MKDQFIPCEQALELKELNFNEPCLAAYNISDNNKFMIAPQLSSYEITTGKNSDVTKIKKVTAPLWQQAFDWFRNEYNLCSWIFKSASRPYKYHYSILKDARVYIEPDNNKSTYEEARLECLKKLINHVREFNQSVREDSSKVIKCFDKYGTRLFAGDYVDLRNVGPRKIFEKEDGQLYFTPYGKDELVYTYFSNGMVKCDQNGEWDVDF